MNATPPRTDSPPPPRSPEPTATASPSPRRPGRARHRWNTTLALLLMFALAGMLHYLAGRYYLRHDLTQLKFYGLS
ncbi:MAG: hypothetical protein U1E27_11285, partial [Kiritimatiellia bacterium]|nr:hypothetical protein [Kiritimatiellia bacterium]